MRTAVPRCTTTIRSIFGPLTAVALVMAAAGCDDPSRADTGTDTLATAADSAASTSGDTGADMGMDSSGDGASNWTDDATAGDGSAGGTGGSDANFGTPEDIALAEKLLADLEGHMDEWSGFNGHEAPEPADPPHGPFVRYYANLEASINPGVVPHGSTLALHNLHDNDPTRINSLTVMQRIPGYNPDHYDWFWAVFSSQGQLVHDERGVALAGRIDSCIGCHAQAVGFDYLFGN